MDKEEQLHSGSRLASASVIAAGCMWGSMGIWVRKCTEAGLDSMQILALRVSVTAVVMAVFLSIYNRELLKIRWKDLWCFLGTGVCSIVFFGYCYNRTIVLASLSVAAILLYTAPIFVMIMSRFLFKEMLSAKKIAALMMAFAGCICVTGILGGSSSVSTAGILTGLGSGFGYALYSIFSRFALERNYHPFTITLYTFACAFAATLFLADWQPVLSFVTESPGNFLYGIGYGVITTVLPYILYTFGLSYVDNSRASIMATVEPVVATLIGVFWFKEKMTAINAVGVLLVLCALVILGRKEE
ncbi:MAG: DMT family transporter [Lachnospiraceae bacterium]|nr:DMT family transporter [Lachnospiraceae bacterium]